MAQLTVIADYGDLCGENPLWDPNSNTLYWTDAIGKRFYRCEWPGRRHELMHAGLEIYGAAMNEPGGFIVTNSSGIWRWDGRDGVKPIASELDGTPLRLNDCIADPAGRLFSGTVFYDPEKEYPLGKLIRLDTDGSVHIVDEGFHLSNGLAFSPDQTQLYFTDCAARRIYVYDYSKKTGDVKNRKLLIQVPDTEGLPDGLTVDADGFLWSAQWYGSRVVRYDPDGKEERRIETPAKQTSSIMFGGPDLTDIFVTSAKHPESMPIMPPGYDPFSGNVGGQLYHINLGIRGRAEYHTNIH